MATQKETAVRRITISVKDDIKDELAVQRAASALQALKGSNGLVKFHDGTRVDVNTTEKGNRTFYVWMDPLYDPRYL
jgi:hypothetical protein